MTKDGGLVCTLSCWGIGALGGLVAMTLLMVLGSFTLMQGAFVGFLVFLVAGGFLSWSLCRPLPALGESRLKRTELPKVEAPTVPRTGRAHPSEPVQPAAMMEEALETVAAKAKSAAAAAQPALDKVVAALGMKDPKADKAERGNRPAALAKPAPVAKPADADRSEDSEKPAAATPAAAKPTETHEGWEGKEPTLLKSARAGGADDLKKIKGVGPKLEQALNGMGIYHYDQIAGWTDEELAWVDENLEGFKGRASRDDWVAQARELAHG